MSTSTGVVKTPRSSPSRSPTHRAQFARERAWRSLDLAHESVSKGLLFAALGYLDEAMYWHTAYQALTEPQP
jgi:hypothetical protein